jgi:hypothetical protein
MHILQVYHVVLTLAQTENDTTAVLLMYGVQKMSGTDCRLSFSDLEVLLLHPYITYTTWMANIEMHH